jgi:hypothetical protein
MISGFLEKEIKKDGIPMLDTGDNPDAPQPREMIDLEVKKTMFPKKLPLTFH